MLFLSSAREGDSTSFASQLLSTYRSKRLPHQPLLILLRRRDAPAGHLGSRHRNIQLCFLLSLLDPAEALAGETLAPCKQVWAGTDPDTELSELLKTASNQRLFYLHNGNCAYSSFLLKTRHLLWDGTFTTTRVVCTGTYHGSGLPCPPYFILKMQASMTSEVQPQQKHL